MKVLFAATEAYPFAKVGGLADVGGALPKALARRGHDVRLILPGYPRLGEGDPVRTVHTALGPDREEVRLQSHGIHQGVPVYSAANGTKFARDLIYGYEDDEARFVLFSKAVVAFASLPDWTPDVIHANDWHLGLVPQFTRQSSHKKVLSDTATVLTIHNLAYQGPPDEKVRPLIGVRHPFRGNLLARGIAFADAINTVSTRYMREILTPEHGMGLDELLRSRRDRLRGILNGIDYDEFDPGRDPHIPAPFDASSLTKRRVNKAALQERSGLRVDPGIPLLGMVARLVDQKGFDLLCASLDSLAELGVQVVVMGVGDERYHRALEEAGARYPGAVAHHDTSEEGLSRLVYAGSDLFLAPSNFEPCGLGPLIALRYGSIPVVRRTGGLAETISDYTRKPDTGLGFTFVAKYPEHLVKTIRRALAEYGMPRRWERLQHRAMAADFSWERSTRRYERLYREALSRRRAEAE